jgi:hypothetical protein
MRIRQLGQSRQCPLNQLQGRRYFPALIGEDPKQMQRVGMVWVLCQHLAVQRLRSVEPSRLMMREACPHGSREAGNSARISPVLGRYHG